MEKGDLVTIEKAIRLLCREYEIAKNLEMVKNPVAYALYKVWKEADSKGGQSRGNPED